VTKKIIGFVQPNFQQGPKELSAYYLPYSAGVLLAYVMGSDQVKEQWDLGPMIWKRDPIDSVAEKIKHCDIIGFSTYVWNHRYNYTLAKRVKELNPQCVTIFGGPEPAITDKDLFRREPFMDVVIKMEGEIVMRSLLETPRDQWSSIPGLLINHDGMPWDTGDSSRIGDLDQLPSPYLTGIFDQLIRDYPDIEWNATLETNRGCPYQCTFCDWGSLTYSKVKKFNLQRVFDELDWIGQHCGFVTITDANFGMFVERDNMIVDHLIGVQKRWEKLKSFSMTWAKNQKNEVVDIVKKLIDQSPNFAQGLTVSVQSMDHDVLENIKRRNLDQHKIDEIFDICDRKNIPVYTEVILGLPGDTEKSWKENFWKIFRAGNHTGINILQAQMLENAEMNLFQKKLWCMESVPVYDYISGSYGDMDLAECIDVVTATRDIPREKMIDLLTWNTFIQTFHINGLTTYLSRFLFKHLDIDYSEFYDLLEKHIKKDHWLSKEFQETRRYFSNWTTQGSAAHPDISSVQVFGWNLVHRVSLLMHQQHKISLMMDLITHFLRQHFSLEDRLLDQLLRFQKNYVIDYHRIAEYPLIIEFDYDFLGYIQGNDPLERNCVYQFEFNEDPTMSLDRFLENIYFARKRNFGKAVVTKH